MNERVIDRNLAAVRKELSAAAAAAGKDREPVLLAAVKYADDDDIRRLLADGITDVGENRVQQLLAHEPLFTAAGVRVHFIGTLQKNKVKYVVDKVSMIHSVDSPELALTIDREAGKRGVCPDVLVEINSGREPDKSGVMPEDAGALCRSLLPLTHLRLRGFMTMGPRCEREEDYRVYFRETRELAFGLWRELRLPGDPFLSMGMSQSFRVAAAEGADLVRVGRRLFEDGTQKDTVSNENHT